MSSNPIGLNANININVEKIFVLSIANKITKIDKRIYKLKNIIYKCIECKKRIAINRKELKNQIENHKKITT